MWWDPELGVTNLGATNFRWAEQNGFSSHAADQVQTTVAKQPALVAVGSHNQWREVGAVDTPGSDIRMISPGNVKAGWSSKLYLFMRHRVAAGDNPSGVTTIFAHQTTSTGLRRITVIHSGTGTDSYAVTLSQDGTAVQQNVWDAPQDGLSHGLEFYFEGAPGGAGFCQLYIDGMLQTPRSAAINLASVNDPNVPLAVGAATGAGIGQNRQDFGLVAYGNDLPSASERASILAYKAA